MRLKSINAAIAGIEWPVLWFITLDVGVVQAAKIWTQPGEWLDNTHP